MHFSFWFNFSGSFPDKKTLVSSANMLMFHAASSFFFQSLQTSKRSGPKTDPCGMPFLTVVKSDFHLFVH